MGKDDLKNEISGGGVAMTRALRAARKATEWVRVSVQSFKILILNFLAPAKYEDSMAQVCWHGVRFT